MNVFFRVLFRLEELTETRKLRDILHNNSWFFFSKFLITRALLKVGIIYAEPQKSLKQVINYTFGELAHFLKAQKIIF
jgi:hypothetical protein